MVCSCEKVPGIMDLAGPPIRAKLKAGMAFLNPSVSMIVCTAHR